MKSLFRHLSMWLCATLLVLGGHAYAQTEWRKLPGAANDIGVGADGSVWVIGTDATPGGFGIYRFNGTGWDRAAGGAVRIDVDPQGNPWTVDDTGKIHRWANGQWQLMPGAATDIGIGANGSVWAIGVNPLAGGYGIYTWDGSKWVSMSSAFSAPATGGVHIDVAANGIPWIVNSNGDIFSFDVGRLRWTQQPGAASPMADLSIGGDIVFGVDKFGRLHRYATGGWVQRQDSRYKSVSVDGDGLPWAVGASGEIFTSNPDSIDAYAPPVVTALNAKYVTGGGTHFVQTEYGKWVLYTSIGPLGLRELQRNATSIQLQTESTQNRTFYLLDFAKKTIFFNLDGQGPGTPMTAASTVHGGNVTYLDLTLHNPSTGALVGRTVLAENFNNGTSTGWTLDSWGTRKSLATGDVARSGNQRVTFRDTASYDVDVLSRQCTATGYACKVVRIEPVTGFNAGQFTINMNGQLHRLTHTHATLNTWQLEGVNADETWEATKRALNYVDFKANSLGVQRARLSVDGSWDAVQPDPSVVVSQGKPVVAAQGHWKGQLGTIPVNPAPGISPGFQIVNKTDYPVLVTLEQVGCLYYEVVQPGQVFQRNTGAVWFTIKASMAPNLQEPTKWSCARDPLLYAAAVVGTAAVTVATGGIAAGSAAYLIPAMIFTAAGRATAIVAEDVILQNGGTSTEGRAARFGVVMLTHAGAPAGLGIVDAGKSIASTGAIWAGTELRAQLAEQKDIDAIKAELVQEAVVAGAYAGPPWPAAMSNRVMPRYDITGGPHIVNNQDGSISILKQTQPLRITRVN